jgi:histone H3/H4
MEENDIVKSIEKRFRSVPDTPNKLTDKMIILIFIIIILTLILGIVIVSAIIINKKNNENVVQTAVSTTNNSTIETTENATTNQTIKQKDIEITYTTTVVKEITVANAKYICREQVPEISGIDETAAKKIQESIKNYNSKIWEDIDSQNSEASIKEILNGAKDYYESYEIGFIQSYKVSYLNGSVITFKSNFDGGIGGVSWATQSGISFNLKTGEQIDIEEIVTSKNNYISVCKEYVFEELKKDSRYAEVVAMHGENYEEAINFAIEQLGGYFTDDGIVCVEIPKYVIASGASGEFRFAIPYEQVSKYIKPEYNFSNINNKASLIKQNYIDNTKTNGTVMKKNK